MKKSMLNQLMLFAFISMILHSCNDLDLNPISSYNSGSFYRTEKDFKIAITGAYSTLQILYSYQVPSTLDGRSDDMSAIQPAHMSDLTYWVSSFTDNAGSPWIDNIWKNYWNQIDKCNAILDKIDDVSFDDETIYLCIKGEAHFLRGLAYFELGRMYGGVPLLNNKLTVDEIILVPRSTQEETFAFAANELSTATQLLPEAWPAADIGRATKYAAQGILARLYMFQNKLSDAKPLLQSIIESGRYQMAAKYEDCFTEAYDNSSEHVFQVQFASGGIGEQNDYVLYCVHENIKEDLFPIGGSRGNYMSKDLYSSYEEGDLRRDFTLLNGWYDKTGNLNKNELFLVKYAHQTQPTSKGDYGVNLPILRYTDVMMMYAEILNEEGYVANGEAFSILNKVRSRAGLNPLIDSEVVSKEAFSDTILHERRVEFAGEYLRWYDLIRTGKAMQIMNAFLTQGNEGGGQYQMQEFHKLIAIPQYELDINPNRWLFRSDCATHFG